MATRKQKSKQRKQRKHSLKDRKPTSLDVHQSYMNVSETWINGKGRRNVVTIKNGKGHKRVERLGSSGEVLEIQNRALSAPEQQQILQGRFVPGLWRNCRLGRC